MGLVQLTCGRTDHHSTLDCLTVFQHTSAGSSARNLLLYLVLLSDASFDAETFDLRSKLGGILDGGVVKKPTVGASDTQTSFER